MNTPKFKEFTFLRLTSSQYLMELLLMTYCGLDPIGDWFSGYGTVGDFMRWVSTLCPARVTERGW